LRYNQRLCEILGYPCEELAELSWAELTHPDDLAADEAQFDRVMRGEIDGYNMDKRYIRKDGSVVNAYIDVKCIRDAHGRVDQFVAMVQDISERKAAEERLRDSEARFRALFDTVTDGILVADLDNGHFVMGNSAIEAMLGYSHEQLTRLNFDDIHPAESLATVHKHIHRQVNEAITLAVELPVLRSDGSVFYADISSAPLTLQGKSYLVGVFRDITQKKQAQEALERARQQAQHYLDIAGTMIIALDLEGRLTLANRLTCELLGYTEEELLGQVWFECCIPPSQREGVKTVFEKLPSAKSDALEYFENPVLTRSGEERLIAWHNVLLRDNEGELYGILSSGEDVTEQRQAEARLIASEARLRTLVDTMPDLVWLKDVEGHYLACNPRFERFFGASEAKIIGKTDYDFVDRELADFFREHDLRAMAAGSPSRNEETLNFADGSYTGTFETIKTPMLDRAGQLIGVLGIARDITQRKQQLAHIERLSRLYETLSHTNKAIVHSSNQDELFRKVCRSAVGSIGFQHAWIALLDDDGHTLNGQTAFTSQPDGSIEERDAGQLIATLQQQDIAESLLQHSPLWCDESDCSLSPWTDSIPATKESRGLTAILPLYRRHHLVGAFGLTAVEDYALGKDARELLLEMATDIGFALDNFELQRQQRIAEEAMRQSANAITILDPSLNFIFTNHAFSELFGYDTEEANGASIALIAPPSDVATLQRDQVKEQVDRHSYYRGEVIRRHKSGELIPVYISAASLLDQEGELVGYVSSYNDMRAIKQSEERLRHALTDTIMAISHTIEKRDPYTAGHQQRVAQLAVAIARKMRLTPDRIEGIYLGSLIHDIGKIYIPSEILNRPGRLSRHEFGLIQSHPEVGYEIIKDVKFDWPIANMVYQHHERIDGSGYPLGLKGEAICLEARIISVADIVEAMTSHRPYRPGLGIEPALAEIKKQAGSSLDQEVVDTCLTLFQEQQFEWTSAFTHS
ncbi:MAG: PAS domain S-box protein, partial [Pseudomonadota bacterium]